VTGAEESVKLTPDIAHLELEGEIAADYLEGLLDIADMDGDIDMDVVGDRAVVSIVGVTGDELVGRGGEVLEALQELIRLAGHGAALGPAGVDGVYGDGTAEGLRLCRADVGSRALPGYGDQVTGHAFAQLIAAVAKHQATKVSGSSTGGVPRHLEVESLTAKRLTVG